MTDLTEVSTTAHAARRESDEYTHIMELVAGKDGPEAIEMLERLVALKERAEDRDAERAMNHAIAAFKAECPPIPKDASVDYATKQGRRVKFSHSKLPTICRVIDPVLTRHGLSYTWDSKPGDSNDLGRVTICRLRHVDGAERTATFHAPPSGVEGSAAVQKVGAALTYGQRYSLVQVLGLTTTMDDVDGMEPADDDAERISDEQLAEVMEWVESTETELGKLAAFMGVETLADLPASKFEFAIDKLKQKANAN